MNKELNKKQWIKRLMQHWAWLFSLSIKDPWLHFYGSSVRPPPQTLVVCFFLSGFTEFKVASGLSSSDTCSWCGIAELKAASKYVFMWILTSKPDTGNLRCLQGLEHRSRSQMYIMALNLTVHYRLCFYTTNSILKSVLWHISSLCRVQWSENYSIVLCLLSLNK